LISQLELRALNIDPATRFLEAGRAACWCFASVVLALTVLVALTAADIASVAAIVSNGDLSGTAIQRWIATSFSANDVYPLRTDRIL